MTMTIGKRVRLFRTNLGLTQPIAARQAGISQAAVLLSPDESEYRPATAVKANVAGLSLALKILIRPDNRQPARTHFDLAVTPVRGDTAHDLGMTTKLTLPDVPSGYFWRVARGTGDAPEVQLRRKVWWFSVRIDHVVLKSRRIPPAGLLPEPAEEIVQAAQGLCIRFRPIRTRTPVWGNFYGDYRGTDRSR